MVFIIYSVLKMRESVGLVYTKNQYYYLNYLITYLFISYRSI